MMERALTREVRALTKEARVLSNMVRAPARDAQPLEKDGPGVGK
jgi:hypothetical protein